VVMCCHVEGGFQQYFFEIKLSWKLLQSFQESECTDLS
jgi:hypothetical protein